MNCCEQGLCASRPLLAYQRPDKRRLFSSGGGFFISESTRTLSGLSNDDERLLKQSGAHCSLAPMHLAVKMENKKVLFWDDRVTDRLTREAGILWRPLHAYAAPLGPALMRFSLSLRAAWSQHAASVTRHLPDSGAAIRSGGAPQRLEFCKPTTKGRL